jgi:hypothetical protein
MSSELPTSLEVFEQFEAVWSDSGPPDIASFLPCGREPACTKSSPQESQGFSGVGRGGVSEWLS